MSVVTSAPSSARADGAKTTLTSSCWVIVASTELAEEMSEPSLNCVSLTRPEAGALTVVHSRLMAASLSEAVAAL